MHFLIALIALITLGAIVRQSVATIEVPEIINEHVQLGLIDSDDPTVSVNNKAFNDLRSYGVLEFEPAGLANIKAGGDLIKVPALGEPADFARVDHASDVDLSANDYTTNTDVAIVQYNKVLHQFKESDAIRSGYKADIEFSRKTGGKGAKRLFQMLMMSSIGAVDAVDTPSANCHTLDVFSGVMGQEQYPTLDLLRQLKQLLGDAGTRLNTAVMSSTSFGWLLYDLITNYGGGNVIGSQAARTGLLGDLVGIQNWLVSDLVPTTSGGGGNQAKQNILLYGPGALWAGFQKDLTVEVDSDIKKPSSRKFMAVSFNSVAHLRFVKTALASNPTDVELVTAASWDEAYDDHRRVLCAKLVCNGVAEVA